MKSISLLVFVFSVVLVHAIPTPPNGNAKGSFAIAEDLAERELTSGFDAIRNMMINMQKQMEYEFQKGIESSVADFNTKFQLSDPAPRAVKNETYENEKVINNHVVKTKEHVFSDGTTLYHSRRVQIVPQNPNTAAGEGAASQPNLPTLPPAVVKTETPKEKEEMDLANSKKNDVENNFARYGESPMGLLGSPSIEQDTFADVPNEIITDSLETTAIPEFAEIDLSGDIKVNTIAENHIREPEPDAEIIEINQINNSNTDRPNQETYAYNPDNSNFYNYRYSV